METAPREVDIAVILYFCSFSPVNPVFIFLSSSLSFLLFDSPIFAFCVF